MPGLLGGFDYTWPYYLGALLGYLLGSIPFGLLLTQAAGLGDIRKIGSGSIGATNVLRTGRKGLAAATLLLDGGKGAAGRADRPALGAGYGDPGRASAPCSAISSRSGCASRAARAWPPASACCWRWIGASASSPARSGCWWPSIFRYSSLAALVASAVAPVAAWFIATRQLAAVVLFLAVLVWLRHHQNIRRLLTGQEPKIGQHKDA